MTKKKEEKIEKEEIIKLADTIPDPMDSLWALLLLSLLFWQPAKSDKVINIYMGDDE